MALQLYAHPFSSYCQKVLIALYENGTPFEFRQVSFGDDPVSQEFAALWPLQKMPLLLDDGVAVVESSIIIEHLGLHHPGPVRLIPEDAMAALAVRGMDRFFDLYIHTPLQKLVFNAIRPEASRDEFGVIEARAALDKAYAWLNKALDGHEWAVGDHFSMADCAAAPALFYADWAHEISVEFANLQAYRRRLLAQPSYARAVDEGRPFRAYFPLGAPDRD